MTAHNVKYAFEHLLQAGKSSQLMPCYVLAAAAACYVKEIYEQTSKRREQQNFDHNNMVGGGIQAVLSVLTGCFVGCFNLTCVEVAAIGPKADSMRLTMPCIENHGATCLLEPRL